MPPETHAENRRADAPAGVRPRPKPLTPSQPKPRRRANTEPGSDAREEEGTEMTTDTGLKRRRHRLTLTTGAVAVFFGACHGDHGRVVSTDPAAAAPASPSGPAQTIARPLISDQTNNVRERGFYWIPPIIQTAAATFTTLDQTGGTNALTVKVDRLFPDNTTTAKTTFTGAAITMVTGTSNAGFPGVTGPFYGVNWAAGTSVASGDVYRITIQALTPSRMLGVADVQVVANATAAGMVDRTKFTPLVAGNTLPIVFRLENKDTDGDTLNDWRDNCPVTKNANQLDNDGDGLGDACQCLNVPSGTTCSTSCKTGQTCQSGACAGGSNASNGTACSTGNACKTGEICTSGSCGGGTNKAAGTACSTGNPCKSGETCTTGACGGGTNKAAGTACSTGNACKSGETCTNGTCGGGTNKAAGTACSTGNPCKSGETCTSGTCGGGANRTGSCDDGNLCTQSDSCQSGICVGSTPITCATDACHNAGACAPTSGVCPARKADGTSCSDGNACNGAEACGAGVCAAGTPPVVDDGNPCTTDACSPTGGVTHVAVANGTSCSDGNACNGAETCQSGTCAAGVPPMVNDGNPCTTDACSPTGGVTHVSVANGTSCSDGNACNGAETCQFGTCAAGVPPVVNDGNPCTTDACSPAGGVTHVAVANGTSCSDGNACNGAETCQAGACAAGTPPVVNDGNPCTTDACSATGGVTHVAVANGTSCSDGNACNGAETCQSGACAAGTPPMVNDGNPCTADACSPTGGVTHTAVADGTSCSDGNACNGVETCTAGVCKPGTPLVVDDSNPCTADACSPTGGVSHSPVANGTACDDGNACTVADSCSAGACKPGPPAPTATCTAAGAPFYVPVVNLGATRGKSYASDINNNGVIVGTDLAADTNADSVGPLATVGFVWDKGNVTFIQGSGPDTFPRGINDSNVVSGTAGLDPANWLRAFRFDLNNDAAFRYVAEGPGTRINAAGVMTGYGYFPGAQQMFRAGTGVVEPLPTLPGPTYLSAAQGNAIDGDGSVVGWNLRASDSQYVAVRYSDANHLQLLQDLISDSHWEPRVATGTNGAQIVGWGMRDMAKRGFVLTLSSDGTSATIVDLLDAGGVVPDPNDVIVPKGINANGEIVGGIYDESVYWPGSAFIWVKGAGLVDLNAFLAPGSPWHLAVANAINESRQVVGMGTFSGEQRAFMMQMPDLSPCPPPADGCHGMGTRDLSIGTCSYPPLPDGTGCDDGNICSQHDTCTAGVCDGIKPPSCATADDVIVSLAGIATDSAGATKAVFTYRTDAVSITIPYGTENSLSDQNGIIASPPQSPPTTFVVATHAPFVASLTVSLLTWTVGIHSAKATPQSNQLPVTTLGDGTRQATLPDGTKVNLDSVPPADPGKGDEPKVGDRFNGVLSGKFGVSPSGAATYTVPIAVPPGIAGMAPNLALVYNSQGGNGIAGVGWTLNGLSTITRCPRTRQQDGYGRPVMMDSLTPASAGAQTDGVCLDGEKLIENPSGSGNYVAEKLDFSTITRSTSGTFAVVTKTGETRIYGEQDKTRAVAPNGETAVWLLERVMDQWGNFFVVEYNRGNGNNPLNAGDNFSASGIWVSKIDYTGFSGFFGSTPTSPFASVTFQYGTRDDWRWTRYGSLRIPQNQLLTSISTPAGTYSLTYAGNQLNSIGYCAGSTCIRALEFGWQNATAGGVWQSKPTYVIPSIPSFHSQGLTGTQFVDINGDGRSDFVLARQNGNGGPNVPQIMTAPNTGSGWGSPLSGPSQTFPLILSDSDDNPTGVRVADLDGDGRLDLIADSANVICDANGCVSCPVGAKPGSPGCIGSTHYAPAVWLNRFTVGWEGGWQFEPSYSDSTASVSFTGSNPAMIGDLDGDGKADLIRVTQASDGDVGENTFITVLRNNGHGWTPPQSIVLSDLPLLTISPLFTLQDVNRDGLADLVHDEFFKYPDGSAASAETVLVNQGPGFDGEVIFAAAISRTPPDGGTPIDVKSRPPHFGDIDGDGFYDLVDYQSAGSPPHFFGAVGFGDGTGYGVGSDPGVQPYFDVLKAFTPPPPGPNQPGVAEAEDYGYALVDIDGDGLVDLVRNHWNRATGDFAGEGGGEILHNTGHGWVSLVGRTAWAFGAPAGAIKAAVPSEATIESASAFVDVDGDGMPDLLQEEGTGSNLPPGAWINPYQRPVINTFPNGLAKPTTITYVSTTSAAGASTYKDDDATEAGTKPFAVPLTVVSTVFAPDGSGTDAQTTTSYTYHSMRQDSFGRGPVGFHRIETFDQASQNRTITTYAQTYPLAGMPIEVDKYQVVGSQAHLTNKTTTTYCMATLTHPGLPLSCGTQVAQREMTFVTPFAITDTAYLHPETDNLADQINTVSTFQFDDNGNATITSTTVTKVEGGRTPETFSKQVQNFYERSEEALEGKPTKTVTTGTGGTKSTTHTTTLEYASVNGFGGATSRLAIVKKHVEPGAGWPIQVDTAYKYDQFGNVITTTSCANDFQACQAGAAAPPQSPPDPLHHPPFRTTTVSYDPSLLDTPVSYGIGRFPSKTTNAAGHTETTVYDPVLGTLITKTGPNGIKTCYINDALGHQIFEIDQCNTATPLVTTTEQFLTLPRIVVCIDPPCNSPTGFSPPNSAVVTVTTVPNGAKTWSYTDNQGKSTGALAFAFDGGFIETTTSYNTRGQVGQVAKPFHLSSLADTPSPSYGTSVYDDFNRLFTVTDPLGVIDSSGLARSTTITTTYGGSTVQTDRVVNGQTQTRKESKNALGKLASVTTQTETGPATISYEYDADGNLTRTTDPAGNQITIGYDTRGRKTSSVDPDMGAWSYIVDGFGDLVSQIDPNARQLDPSTHGTTMTYDSLGRMISKTDTTGTGQWIYDVAPGAGIGKLAAMVSPPNPALKGPCTNIPAVPPNGTILTDGNRSGRSFQYTTLGQIQQVTECVDGEAFATSYGYDPIGRQNLIRYPVVNRSQLAVGYHYTSAGYLQYLTDDSADQSILWQAKAMNALGQVTDEQMRNGVETLSNRNPLTGWLLGSTATAHADGDNIIQKWNYAFDEIGNLVARSRADAASGASSSETFGYDLTNRLTSALTTTSSGYNHPESYVYDVLGNLKQKAGSAYTYGAGCAAGTRSAGPHAVCTVAGGGPFVYDSNGNLTNSGSRSVTYNPSNKVTHVESGPMPSQGNDTGAVDFIYGADGDRVVQSVTSGSVNARTVYVGLGATGKSLYERTATTGVPTKHVHFIYAGSVHGGNAFALRVLDDSGAVTANRYYSFDHLGSVTATSDDQGRVASAQTAGPDATVLGYDAWGARRNPDGSAASAASFNQPLGNREFSGQEQIPNVGLVNMNGRLYDPQLGRFLSPDPNVQFVADLQSHNRYSYAGNNPLRYTDPTGYFWQRFGYALYNYFSNPLNDFAFVGSLAICAGTEVGCAAFGLMIAGLNAYMAIADGAGFGQTVLNTSIGLGIGLATGGLGQSMGLNGWQELILGAASSAVTTMISNGISGRDPLGANVLEAVVISAAQGAATMGLKSAIGVSQASSGVEVREPYDRKYLETRNDVDSIMGSGAAEPEINERGMNDPVICGQFGSPGCAIITEAAQRSGVQQALDKTIVGFATSPATDDLGISYDTVGRATYATEHEFVSLVRQPTDGGLFVAGDPYEGQAHGGLVMPWDDLAAVNHTHPGGSPTLSWGDIRAAETLGVTVTAILRNGVILSYDPNTNTMYRLDYLGRYPH
jgi:RHS repeat-associated protein